MKLTKSFNKRLARDAALHRTSGPDGGVAGVARLTVYASDQTHTPRSTRRAGLDPANMRCIPASAETGYALDSAMRADGEVGLVSTSVCATVGTTSSNAVDPVGAVTDVAARFGAWVHVDAAYNYRT
jgi:aromatic-L-amino-acid/L-tryptophan decarboxylase